MLRSRSFPRVRAGLCLALVSAILAGCLGDPAESAGSECEAPVGPAGPGFIRHAYFVRVQEGPEGGATFRAPIPVAQDGEPAPVLDCLLLHSGDASWRLTGDPGAQFLEVTTRSASATVRASYLIETYSNDTLARTNWSLAPLDRTLTGAPPPPSGSKDAFPIGDTRVYAGTSGVLLRVYYAVDASAGDEGARVAHRQDVLERRTSAGWQDAVVFREYQTFD